MIPGTEGVSFWYVTDLVISSLSLLGSLLLIYFCLRAPSPWSTSIKFILAIAISDLLFSVANLMSAFEKGNEIGLMCKIEAMVRQSSWFLTIYFGACVAVFTANSYIFVKNFDRQGFFLKSVLIGLAVCACSVLGPLIFSENVGFEKGPIECWIAPVNKSASLNLFFLAIYEAIPLLVGSFVTLRSYMYIIQEIKTLPKSVLEQIDVRVYSLLWFPMVPFLSNLLCLVDNMIKIFDHNQNPLSLWKKIAHLLIPHAIGLTNALVYVVQKRLYSSGKTHEQRTASVASACEVSLMESRYEDDWENEVW